MENESSDRWVCKLLPAGWKISQVSPRSLWHDVHYPIQEGDLLPPERKVVLCWLSGLHLPYCGYVRYAAGDQNCPYFVVYHGNPDRGAEVVSWCDCLPAKGPESVDARMYDAGQPSGRGVAGGVWKRIERGSDGVES